MNVFATSPAHGPAREARAQIDAIAESLRASTSPVLDRRGVAERLARAIRSLYAVLDTTLEAPAHQDGLDECVRALGEAKTLLGAAASDPIVAEAAKRLDAIHAQIAATRESVVDATLTRRDHRSQRLPALHHPFRASTASPQLHALARTPVAPPLEIDAPEPESIVQPKRPPPPKPQTIEELRAAAAAATTPPEPEPEPEPAPATKPIPIDDGEVIRRVARECLEDIAALHVLRKPIPTETWRDQAPFEQRLLDNIDAFVSLGERALPSVTLFHAEAPAPDPSRAFAVALTLGCIEGTDTVDVAIATMKQSAPAELPGFAEGLVLAPSPAIDAELPALLDAPNPALAGVALDVLGRRGTLPLDAADRIRPRRDRALTQKLARALGHAGAKTRALATLNDLLDEAPDDEDLFITACTSLLRRGDGNVRQRLRSAIRDPRAFSLLALSARGDDAPLLLDAFATQPPTGTMIQALARFGSAASLPALIALLANEELAPAAAAALDFITNAGLVETTEVPWTPGVEPPDGAPPPMRKVTIPIAEREPWETWYARVKSNFDPRLKLRHGVPFAPSMIVHELGANGAAEHRELACLELVVATGLGMRLSPSDWVAKQERQLGEIDSTLPSLGNTPGAWWFGGAAITNR
ncbi:MAG: hypothetical protein KIT84_10680 [Labilithrix sp.]|nr:hypothetical protein [Labilithrix sp.]MCW5811471.1 hypothetical protein [Labilithrix sp.]